MTLDSHKELAKKYILPDQMYYIVVGDAASQLKPLNSLGMGVPELVK
jgi:zinc protease